MQRTVSMTIILDKSYIYHSMKYTCIVVIILAGVRWEQGLFMSGTEVQKVIKNRISMGNFNIFYQAGVNGNQILR